MLQSDSQLTIAIVDDHPIVIEGLQKLLTTEFKGSEILEFSSGDEFISCLKETKVVIDIVLLDITLPGKKGTDLCTEIKYLKSSILTITGISFFGISNIFGSSIIRY